MSRGQEVSLSKHPVVLFDGVCNLCSSSVRFIIQRDPHAVFRFASLQSETGRRLLQEKGMDVKSEPDSVVLVEEHAVHVKTDAVLRIAARLSGLWPLFRVFRILPRSFRDPVYDWVGRNRYRWFGRQDYCAMPDPSLRARFL